MPLEGDVVDRDRGSRTRPIGVVKIGGRERRLPVMRVDHLRPERVDRSKTDIRAYARKRRKAASVVGPVESVRGKVRIAGPVIEVRRVYCEQVEVGRLAGEDARGSSEQVCVSVRGLSVG